jgi:hypothetical protein
LGPIIEIPNLEFWLKIALQNGRSLCFRGGLKPSDLGDSSVRGPGMAYQLTVLDFQKVWVVGTMWKTVQLHFCKHHGTCSLVAFLPHLSNVLSEAKF